MTLDEAVYSLLTQAAAVAARVGDRVYPGRAPEDVASPWITYQRVSGESDHTLQGPNGLEDTRLQIDCWSVAREGIDAGVECRAVAIAVKAALDGFRGTVTNGNSPTGSLVVKSTRLVSDQDLPEDGPPTSRVSLDFMFGHDRET